MLFCPFVVVIKSLYNPQFCAPLSFALDFEKRADLSLGQRPEVRVLFPHFCAELVDPRVIPREVERLVDFSIPHVDYYTILRSHLEGADTRQARS